jgi:hypothetical protein
LEALPLVLLADLSALVFADFFPAMATLLRAADEPLNRGEHSRRAIACDRFPAEPGQTTASFAPLEGRSQSA